MCIVGARTVVGEGCVLVSRVTLGADVVIGPGSTLYPGAVIYDRCSLGAQVILHANVSIGADGFGYVPHADGRGLLKVPHIGTVKIGNGVEIGANSCVDGASSAQRSSGTARRSTIWCRWGTTRPSAKRHHLRGERDRGERDDRRRGDRGRARGRGGRVHDRPWGEDRGQESGVMCDVQAGEVWTGVPAARQYREQMRTWW